MARCDNCEGIGPADFLECPYCGDQSPVTQDLALETTTPQNELEAVCTIVREGLHIAAQNMYNVGRALIRLIDDKLWEQKIGEDGQPLYDSPYKCIEDECGLKPRAARKLVKVARAYDEKAFAEHGLTRLDVSLRLPKARRQQFFKKVKYLPKRGPEDRVIAREMLNETVSTTTSSDKSIDTPVSTPPSAPKTARVRLKLGVTTVPMHRRQTARDTTREPAMSLREYPMCDVHLGGDLFLGIRITRDTDGHLLALLDVREVRKSSGSDTISIGY